MPKTLILALALLCAIPFAGLAAESMSIVPLDELPLSSAERTLLDLLILQLEELLADETLGSLQPRNATGWKSAAFAAYTAGSLAERGYRVYLASGLQGSDGLHTWVIAHLIVGSQSVWIPIEPSPSFGALQRCLGTIAWESGAGSNRTRFDPTYVEPIELWNLPANRHPVIRLRINEDRFFLGARVEASAAGSFDPDGRIVVYRWCVNDEPCTSSHYWKLTRIEDAAGEYTVTLSVIDAGGLSSSARAQYFVMRSPDDEDPGDGGGCGCSQ